MLQHITSKFSGCFSSPDLDVSKGHPDAGQLDADVVRPAVLH